MKRSYLPYLRTLRRIPAPIICAMATREIIPINPEACLCGWAIREALAFANGHTAEDVTCTEYASDPRTALARKFGGGYNAWSEIFFGILNDSKYPAIEEAFAIRVAECVR